MAHAEQTPAYRAALRDVARGTAAAALVGLFVNLLYLAMPLFTIQVYDRVISSGSLDTLAALVGLVAVVLIFQAVLDYMRHRIFAILGARLASRLGRPVFEAAVEMTLRSGAGAATGALRDLGDLRAFVAGGAIALPLDLLVTPFFVVVLFLMHPLYGTVGVIGAGLLTMTAVSTEFLVRRPSSKANAVSGNVQAETAAAIRNAEVITAMGMLPAISARWRRSQAESLASIERGRARAKGLAAIAKSLRLGIQIAIVCTGATLVLEHEATGGTIMAAAVIMSRLLLPFEHLIEGWRQWMDAFGALERIRDVLARGATTRSPTPVAVERGVLTVDRLVFTPAAQNKPLLRNVSFRIEAGELLGVVGPSGAGKSTLARLVVGLWTPTAGGIFLDGQSTFAHERGSFGRAVGYLPQDPMLLEGTVAENIARFREAEMADVVAAARLAGVHELIGRLPQGYATPLADAGARLSGGQRQRLALARAVFGEPRLIVLDEPNSNLDAEGESALVAAIDIARARGAAVLVVAQRMSILSRADRLLVLRDGAVAQFGEREEVLATLGPRPAVRGAKPKPLPVRGAGA